MSEERELLEEVLLEVADTEAPSDTFGAGRVTRRQRRQAIASAIRIRRENPELTNEEVANQAISELRGDTEAFGGLKDLDWQAILSFVLKLLSFLQTL